MKNILVFSLVFLPGLIFGLFDDWHPRLGFSQDAVMTCNQYGPNGLLFGTAVGFYSRYADVFFFNQFNPNDERLFLSVTVKPYPFFDIRANFGTIAIFKALGYGYVPMSGRLADPYGSTNAPLTNSDKSGSVNEFLFTLKAKYGPVMGYTTLGIHSISLPGSGCYLERKSFLVLSNSDTYMSSDTAVLYETAGEGSPLFGFNLNITWHPYGHTYIRPAGVLVFRPGVEKLKDFNVIVTGGYNLALKELFLAYAAGFRLTLLGTDPE